MQRTLGEDEARLDDEPPSATVVQPVSATSKTSGARERRAHFMRPF
jgi:hypothetical protein